MALNDQFFPDLSGIEEQPGGSALGSEVQRILRLILQQQSQTAAAVNALSVATSPASAPNGGVTNTPGANLTNQFTLADYQNIVNQLNVNSTFVQLGGAPLEVGRLAGSFGTVIGVWYGSTFVPGGPLDGTIIWDTPIITNPNYKQIELIAGDGVGEGIDIATAGLYLVTGTALVQGTSTVAVYLGSKLIQGNLYASQQTGGDGAGTATFSVLVPVAVPGISHTITDFSFRGINIRCITGGRAPQNKEQNVLSIIRIA